MVKKKNKMESIVKALEGTTPVVAICSTVIIVAIIGLVGFIVYNFIKD